MIKKIKAKLHCFLEKRKRKAESSLLINEIVNAKNEDDRSDAIIKLYNLGFKSEAIELAANFDYYEIVSTHYLSGPYTAKDFKKDLKHAIKAVSLLIVGFILVALLTL